MPELPRECFEAIVERLPHNCIPLAIRQLSKEHRQRYLRHTWVRTTGVHHLPAWAVLAAVPYLWNSQPWQLMAALAWRGDLDIMRRLAEQQQAQHGHSLVTADTLHHAAFGGSLDVVRWIVEEQECRQDGFSWACRGAAGGGQVHVLEYLKLKQPQLGLYLETCQAAARGGHVAVLEWLGQNGCGWRSSRVAAAAAQAGRLSTLRWMRAAGCPLGNDCLKAAAARGHIEVLRFLVQQRCPWSAGVADKAAGAGQLEALRWLREHGCPWDHRCWESAVGKGDLAVMELLHTGECPRGYTDLVWAGVRSKQLKALRWLGEHGWPMTINVSILAAEQGDLEMLQWAHERVPAGTWDGVAAAAAHCRRMECLQWLLDNGYPWSAKLYRRVQAEPALRHVRFPGVRRSGRRQAA